MATTLEELVVKIQADVSDLKSSMQESQSVVASATQSMGQSLSGLAEHAASSGSSFSHAMETALGVFSAEALLEGIKKAGELIADIFKETVVESVKAAEAYEDALNRLNISMQIAGHGSAEASADMAEYAESIQKTTRFSEDAVLQGAALIETLTSLDKDGLKRATSASVELAQVLKIDLQSAAMMVGRAFNGNVTALNRHGIAIEQGNSSAETYANTLSALARFNGAAAAATGTFSGAVAQMQNAVEESRKETGLAVVQNSAFIEVLHEITAISYEFADANKANNLSLKQLLGEGLILTLEALVDMSKLLDVVSRVGIAAFHALSSAAAEAAAVVTDVMGIFSSKFKAMSNELDKVAHAEALSIAKAFTEDSKLGEATKLLERLQAAAQNGFAKITEGGGAAQLKLEAAAKAAKKLSDAMVALGQEGEKVAKRAIQQDPNKKYQDEAKALNAAHKQHLISDTQFNQASVQIVADRNKKINEMELKRADDLIAINADLAMKGDSESQERIKTNQVAIDAILANEQVSADTKTKIDKKVSDAKKKLLQEELTASADTLGNMATLAKEFGKDGFEAAKQFSAAEATVKGVLAVQAALASAPPPFNYVLAATVGAVAAVNVGKIEATQLAGGIDSVPGVGNADNFPAILAPGERVVPAKTNQKLTAFLDGNSPMVGLLQAIVSKVSHLSDVLLNTPMIATVDNRAIISAVRDGTRSGRLVFG